MKWQKERDDLIAQTKAFVQSVTGRTPQMVLGSNFNNSFPIDKPLVAAVPADPVMPPLSATHAIQVSRSEATPVEPMMNLPPIKPAPGDVRKEIQTRVAAFQAHQHRFHRERDAYFNLILSKARSGTDSVSDDAPPL